MAIEDQVRVFAEQVAQDSPELKAVLDHAKAGSISEEDALRAMSEILGSNPDLARRFQTMLQDMYAGAAAEMAVAHPDHGGLILHKKRGLARLNPLVEAALIERVQFDDDMPELRTGTMTPGAMPAVAVDTRVRNPAVLGVMLQQASQQVTDKIAAAEPGRQKFIAQVAEGTFDPTALALIEQMGAGLMTRDELQDQVLDGKAAALDIPEYRRGALPALVTVAPPSGSAIMAMTPQEKKQGAWRFLSTTHGRRTAVAGLTELIEVKLRGEGFDVQVRPFEPGAREVVLKAHEWSVGIDGPGAVQPAFSLIDVAAASIAKGLTRGMGDRRGRVILEVTAINTVDVRSVGWAGRLLSRDAALSADMQ